MTPEPIPIAGKLTYSEEEMGHWTPTGVEPKDYDDDEHFRSVSSPCLSLCLSLSVSLSLTLSVSLYLSVSLCSLCGRLRFSAAPSCRSHQVGHDFIRNVAPVSSRSALVSLFFDFNQ